MGPSRGLGELLFTVLFPDMRREAPRPLTFYNSGTGEVWQLRSLYVTGWDYCCIYMCSYMQACVV